MGPWLRSRFGRQVVKIGLDAGLGCPNRDGTIGLAGCSFCPPGGSGRGQGGLSIAEQVKEGVARLRDRSVQKSRPLPAVLAYFQAHSSTHGSPPRLAALYAQARSHPLVAGIIISTRPDCLDGPRWDLLQKTARRIPLWLEMGLQSAHDATLRAIGRGHDLACFDRTVREAHKRGIKVVAHVILGLPGEDIAQTDATAEHLAGLEVWGVKMHNLMILGQTALAGEFAQGRLSLWTREKWAQAAASFLARLPRRMLIHRLAADPGPDELVAPKWAADKNQALKALNQRLQEDRLEQGAMCP